jgi:peptidoglycan hydrolase-like protein with peptidoglycan-binding domain
VRRFAGLLIALSLAAPAAAQSIVPGAHGAAVKKLQRLLVRDGFRLAVDGQYGPGTKKAVRRFQRTAGLRVTGVADDLTLAALGNTSGGAQAPDGSPASAPPPVPAPATSASTGGTEPAGAGTTPAPSTPTTTQDTTPGPQGTIGADDEAIAPASAPQAVKLAIAGGNQINTLPYRYGGGHASFEDTAYDCSGSVSYVLHAAGLLDTTMVSGDLAKWGDPGPGKWITIYANAEHTWVVVAGLRFDTARYDTGPTVNQQGPRWRSGPRPTDGFVVRHPTGF